MTGHQLPPDPSPAPPALSRRTFVAAATAATAFVAMGAGRPPAALTAQQIVDRVRARVGVPWQATTDDGFKAGDPSTVVTGIATMTLPTLDALRRAAAATRNLIVVCEPLFATPDDDPVQRAKRAFIDEQRLVVWRFAEHWGARRPNEFGRALATTLGITGEPVDDDVYTVPPTTLGALASRARTALDVRGSLRVIGDGRARVSRLLVAPGGVDLERVVRGLRGTDTIVVGEAREWEGIEYAFDSQFTTAPKSLIAVGRVVSEGPGMRACADWLRTIVPEVPVDAIPMRDPYWSPVA